MLHIDWGIWLYPAIGISGGLLGAASKDGRLQLPRMTIERVADGDVVRYIHPGFLLAPAVGSMVAGMVDGNSWMAMGAAFAVGYLGPATAYRQFVAPMLQKAGTIPTPAETPREEKP